MALMSLLTFFSYFSFAKGILQEITYHPSQLTRIEASIPLPKKSDLLYSHVTASIYKNDVLVHARLENPTYNKILVIFQKSDIASQSPLKVQVQPHKDVVVTQLRGLPLIDRDQFKMIVPPRSVILLSQKIPAKTLTYKKSPKIQLKWSFTFADVSPVEGTLEVQLPERK